MDKNQKEQLKAKIIKLYGLYKLQHSRIKRIIKAPFKTIPHFIIIAIAYIHPFKITYKTLWGDKMRFYLPEGNAIRYYGFFEANLTNFFINFFKEGDIFIDIGAHVGFYSKLVSKLVSERGKVHSFEPTPRTFESLKENLSPNKNATLNNNAVLNEEKEIEFADYGPKYSAFNSFKERKSKEMGFLSSPEIIRVKSINLDKYCASKNINPTLIKIDAEGAEYLILGGMTKILEVNKPVVTIEVAGEDEWKDNCKKSIEILESKKYLPFEITLEGYLKKHKRQNTYLYDNLVFIHSEKLQNFKSLILE
ncbi:MAG: FkbM family methyltransferase [Candidatus Taylorbacteria bacterium]|nr:FkbM family methyltransferase [Candidatus Taylorbacteria bacterium]